MFDCRAASNSFHEISEPISIGLDYVRSIDYEGKGEGLYNYSPSRVFTFPLVPIKAVSSCQHPLVEERFFHLTIKKCFKRKVTTTKPLAGGARRRMKLTLFFLFSFCKDDYLCDSETPSLKRNPWRIKGYEFTCQEY